MKRKTAVILVICIILALAAGAAGSKTSGKGSGNRKGDRCVDTGDESHIGLWLTIAILAYSAGQLPRSFLYMLSSA